MSDDAQRLTLTMLRKLDEKLENVMLEVRDLKRSITLAQGEIIVAQRRLERLEERMGHVEKREEAPVS